MIPCLAVSVPQLLQFARKSQMLSSRPVQRAEQFAWSCANHREIPRLIRLAVNIPRERNDRQVSLSKSYSACPGDNGQIAIQTGSHLLVRNPARFLTRHFRSNEYSFRNADQDRRP